MKNVSMMLAILMFVTMAPGAVSGATIEGVAFEKRCIEADHQLDLRGAGLFRYMVVIKAYVGALYLPKSISSGQALADVPKRLEISYFHAIEEEDFGAATIDGIRKNVDAASFSRLQSQIEHYNAFYRDVRPGDRYALTYIPGRGTTLSLNGNELGLIPGAEFASALFSIWLGQSPVSQQFKKQLLGKG